MKYLAAMFACISFFTAPVGFTMDLMPLLSLCGKIAALLALAGLAVTILVLMTDDPAPAVEFEAGAKLVGELDSGSMASSAIPITELPQDTLASPLKEKNDSHGLSGSTAIRRARPKRLRAQYLPGAHALAAHPA